MYRSLSFVVIFIFSLLISSISLLIFSISMPSYAAAADIAYTIDKDKYKLELGIASTLLSINVNNINIDTVSKVQMQNPLTLEWEDCVINNTIQCTAYYPDSQYSSIYINAEGSSYTELVTREECETNWFKKWVRQWSWFFSWQFFRGFWPWEWNWKGVWRWTWQWVTIWTPKESCWQYEDEQINKHPDQFHEKSDTYVPVNSQHALSLTSVKIDDAYTGAFPRVKVLSEYPVSFTMHLKVHKQDDQGNTSRSSRSWSSGSSTQQSPEQHIIRPIKAVKKASSTPTNADWELLGNTQLSIEPHADQHVVIDTLEHDIVEQNPVRVLAAVESESREVVAHQEVVRHIGRHLANETANNVTAGLTGGAIGCWELDGALAVMPEPLVTKGGAVTLAPVCFALSTFAGVSALITWFLPDASTTDYQPPIPIVKRDAFKLLEVNDNGVDCNVANNINDATLPALICTYKDHSLLVIKQGGIFTSYVSNVYGSRPLTSIESQQLLHYQWQHMLIGSSLKRYLSDTPSSLENDISSFLNPDDLPSFNEDIAQAGNNIRTLLSSINGLSDLRDRKAQLQDQLDAITPPQLEQIKNAVWNKCKGKLYTDHSSAYEQINCTKAAFRSILATYNLSGIVQDSVSSDNNKLGDLKTKIAECKQKKEDLYNHLLILQQYEGGGIPDPSDYAPQYAQCVYDANKPYFQTD